MTSTSTSTSTTAPPPASGWEEQGAGDGPGGMESATLRDDGRAGHSLMSRQVGSLNVWKAPVAASGPPAPGTHLRYAKRCSRSPSPIPRRKVSFRLSAVAGDAAAAGSSSALLLPSLADTENRSASFCTFDDDTARSSCCRPPRRSGHAHSMTESTSSSISSVKSSLKVSRQSVSVVRTYDPTTILQEDDEKRVTFSFVSVHLHSMTLGDNPAVSAGVPVQIDWKPTESFTRPLDEYESEKDSIMDGRPARPVQQLRIGPTRRENLLKEAGEDRGDVLCVLRSIALIQASRAKNAGAVSVDAASSSSSSSRNDHSPPSSQRIRSGTPLPKVLQRFVVRAHSPRNIFPQRTARVISSPKAVGFYFLDPFFQLGVGFTSIQPTTTNATSVFSGAPTSASVGAVACRRICP